MSKISLKILTVVFIIIFLLLTAGSIIILTNNHAIETVQADSGFAGGNGTEDDPYLIENQTQLQLLNNYLGETYKYTYFKLNNDIQLTGSWKSIGEWNFFNRNRFYGKLEGNGKTISGLKGSNGGLFGAIQGSVIQNLKIEISQEGIGNAENENTSYGGLSNFALGNNTITNCSVTGGDVVGGSRSGGLIGNVMTVELSDNDVSILINNSYSTVNVKSKGSAGGFIGYISVASLAENTIILKIQNSYSTGNVQGQGSIGGFIGEIYGDSNILNMQLTTIFNISIQRCYSSGSVTLNGEGNAGSFIGEITAVSSLSNDIATNSLIIYIQECYAFEGKPFIKKYELDFSKVISSEQFDIKKVIITYANIDKTYHYKEGNARTSVDLRFSDNVVLKLEIDQGIGKTFSEMKSSSTYSTWNIGNTGWEIVDGQLPVLKGFTQEVILDRGEGSGGTDKITVTSGSALPVAVAPNPTNSFGGYFTEPGGKGVQIYDENMNAAHNWFFNPSSTVATLYADYPYAPTDICYNDGFGGQTTIFQKWKNGETYQITDAPIREGYIFKGWFDATYENKITSVVANKDITKVDLYAYWQAETSVTDIETTYLSESTTIKINTSHNFGESLEILLKSLQNGEEIHSEQFIFLKTEGGYSFNLTNAKMLEIFKNSGSYSIQISGEVDSVYIYEEVAFKINKNKVAITSVGIEGGKSELTCHTSDAIIVTLDGKYSNLGKVAFRLVLPSGASELIGEYSSETNVFIINMNRIYNNNELLQYLSMDEFNTFKIQFVSAEPNILSSDIFQYKVKVNRYKVDKPSPITSSYFVYNGGYYSQPYASSNYYVIGGTTSATDAGTHEVEFILLKGYVWSDGSIENYKLSWKIQAAVLSLPKLASSSKTYKHGQSIDSLLYYYNSELMDLSGDLTASNVGSYIVVVSLKSTNYIWRNGSTENLELHWEIIKYQIPKYEETTFTFNSQIQSLYCPSYLNVKSGEVSAKFVGDYSATFEIKDKNNYEWADGSIEDAKVDWKIVKADVSMSSINIRNKNNIFYEDNVIIEVSLTTTQGIIYADQNDYYGKVRIDLEGFDSFYFDNVRYSYCNIIIDSSKYGDIGLKNFTITYIGNQNYNDVTFQGNQTFEVKKKRIEWKGLVQSTMYFDGTEKIVLPRGINIDYFKDNEGNYGTEIGNYTYSFELKDTVNYSLYEYGSSDSIIKTGEWQILGIGEIEITTESLSYGSGKIEGNLNSNITMNGMLSLYFNGKFIIGKGINSNNSYWFLDISTDFFKNNNEIVVDGENLFTVNLTYTNEENTTVSLDASRNIIINKHQTEFSTIKMNDIEYKDNNNIVIEAGEYIDFEVMVSGFSDGNIEVYINNNLIKTTSVLAGIAGTIELQLEEYKELIVFGEIGVLKLKFIPTNNLGYTEIEKTFDFTVQQNASTIILQVKNSIFLRSSQIISVIVNEDIEGVVEFWVTTAQSGQILIGEVIVVNKLASLELSESVWDLMFIYNSQEVTISVKFIPSDSQYSEVSVSKNVKVESFDSIVVYKSVGDGTTYKYGTLLSLFYINYGSFRGVIELQFINASVSGAVNYVIEDSYSTTIKLTQDFYDIIKKPGSFDFSLKFITENGENFYFNNSLYISLEEKQYNIHYFLDWMEITEAFDNDYKIYYQNIRQELPLYNDENFMPNLTEFTETNRIMYLFMFSVLYGNYDDAPALEILLRTMQEEEEDINIPEGIDRTHIYKGIIYLLFHQELANQIMEEIMTDWEYEPGTEDYYVMEEMSKRIEKIYGNNYIYNCFLNNIAEFRKEFANFDILKALMEEGLPLLNNFQIEGWYLGTKTGCDFTTPITEISGTYGKDLYIYLKYSEIPDDNKINYKLNGGILDYRNPTNYTGNEDITIYSPTQAHHRFIGWTYEGQNIPTIDPIIPQGTSGILNFVAHWETISYVAYLNESGEIEQQVEGLNPDRRFYNEEHVTQDYFLKQPSYRAGYVFLGWYREPTFINKVEMIPKEELALSYDINQNAWYINVYAKWEPIKYFIEYNANDGSGFMENSEHIYGIEKELKANSYKRNFYNFIGWALDASGNGKLYQNTESVINMATLEGEVITLYAQWEEISYSISYNLNGGENNPVNPVNYSINSGIITIQDPTRDGYEFFGWTFEGQSFPIKNPEISTETSGDLIFVAHWVEYRITYYNDEGVFNENPNARLYDQDLILINLPNKTGYKFIGWFSEPYFSNQVTVIYANSTTDTDIELYAKWEVEYYKIYFILDWFMFYSDNYSYKSGYIFPDRVGLSDLGKTADIIREMNNAKLRDTLLYHLFNNQKENYDNPEIKRVIGLLLRDQLLDGQTIEDWVYNEIVNDESFNPDKKTPEELFGESWFNEYLDLVKVWISKDLFGNEIDKLTSSDLALIKNLIFEGWYIGTIDGCDFTTEITEISSESTLTGDLYLYAKFSTVPPEDHRINYELNGGINDWENPFYYSSDYENFTLNNPYMVGYNFIGWTFYGQQTPIKNPTITPVAGVTYLFTAHWGFDIKYDLDGGTNNEENPSYYQEDSGNITIKDPTKTGYEFLGWTFEGQDIPMKNPVIVEGSSESFEFVAVWKGYQHSIDYVLNGGTNSLENLNLYNIEDGDIVVKNATRIGYTFLGWTFEGQDTPIKNPTISVGSSKDYVFVAHWEIIKYQITYIDAGTNSENPQEYTIESENLTIIAPKREGYIFLGWTLSDEGQKVSTINIPKGSFGDYFLTAHWEIIQYQITYINAWTNLENPQQYTVESGEIVIKNATRIGYTFLGWTFEGQDIPIKNPTISRGSTKDYVFVAHWGFEIKYDLDGGINNEENPSYYQEENEEIIIKDPTKVGYEFLGWTFEGQDTPIKNPTISRDSNKDYVFTAHWGFEIKYNLDGGTNNEENPSYYQEDNEEIIIKDPTKVGYEFLGWTFEGQDIPMKNPVIVAGSRESFEFVAHWEKIYYSIEYEFNGIIYTGNLTLTYTIEDEVLLPTDLFREGFIFIGWYLTSDFEGVVAVSIPEGSYGNRQLYAKWILETPNIVINRQKSDKDVYLKVVLDKYNPDISYVYQWQKFENNVWMDLNGQTSETLTLNNSLTGKYRCIVKIVYENEIHESVVNYEFEETKDFSLALILIISFSAGVGAFGLFFVFKRVMRSRKLKQMSAGKREKKSKENRLE